MRPWTALLLATFSLSCSCSSPSNTTTKPTAPSAPVAPAAPAPSIDSLLQQAWARASITPAPAADDATFLRRVSLDLWGRLPMPSFANEFFNDKSPDKRAHLVDRLLADPRFGERFAVVFTDVLLGEAGPTDNVDRAAFRSWLNARMLHGSAWDAIAREIIAGSGVNSPGGARKDRAIAAHAVVADAYDSKIHGHVNYLLQFKNNVENLTGKTSRVFLGIQIQCAQCHDHKTESWTTDQFRSLAAAFIQTRGVPVEDREKGEMRVVDVQDKPRAKLGPKATDAMRAIAATPPKALDGTPLDDTERRKALADWITSKHNATFAKAFVNRVWAQFLGSGFVEPVDDFRPGNKPTMPDMLDALAEQFVNTKYNIRKLYRTIVLSEAYARSAGPSQPLWSSFAMRPLPAVVLFDMIINAADIGPSINQFLGERAEIARARTRQQFVLTFDVDEDAGTHDFEGGIPHALLLANGALTRIASRAINGGELIDILRMPGGDDAKITTLYQRTLSRDPTAEEIASWKQFLDQAPEDDGAATAVTKPGDPLARLDKRLQSQAKTPRDRAYEDLFWALLNSSEMTFQH